MVSVTVQNPYQRFSTMSDPWERARERRASAVVVQAPKEDKTENKAYSFDAVRLIFYLGFKQTIMACACISLKYIDL
jgi:hypothetical protein